MNILMIGSQCSTSGNLKIGLERLGHHITLIHSPSFRDESEESCEYPLTWALPFRKKYGDNYDIIHIHSINVKKMLMAFPYILSGVPLVCHWHGSDLRLIRKSLPIKLFSIKKAKINFYSTNDLSWFIKTDRDKKQLLYCPIDTELFKPSNNNGSGVMRCFAGSIVNNKINHTEMPDYYNKFSKIEKRLIRDLDDTLMSVIDLEAASCGLSNDTITWIDRKWVIDNASIDIISKKVEKAYLKILGSLHEK